MMKTEGEQLRRLVAASGALIAEHDAEAVLDRILREAREITGARYAALGVLDEQRTELERFITVGIDAATHRAIGDLPHGRGVLGVLITEPLPLRLSDVGNHHESYGFPTGHPEMRSFLGVPIVIRGEAWGNLYLAEKESGADFTEADEEAAVLLAQLAATAIESARLYGQSEKRREQLERAVRALEATRDIADTISGEASLDRILELIAKRGRALIDARSILIMLREGDDLVVVATAGYAQDVRGIRLPVATSTSGQILERGISERIPDVQSRLRVGPKELGVPDARSALLVPLLHRGTGLGVLAAYDRGRDGDSFTGEDEQLLRTFAASAANAVAINRSVEADRLRATIAAADAERGRWARELHDQTLQSLGAVRVTLASIVGRGDATTNATVRQAIEDIELEIGNLRGMISDLRPSILDDLGLLPAIEALLRRRRDAGLEIETHLDLPDPQAGEAGLDPDLETTIYRLVQESLTNIVKHASASTARVAIALTDGQVTIDVEDDGVGFDINEATSGFGLAGMRERVYLAGGTVRLESAGPGTLVRARLPRHDAAGRGTPSSADQVAS